MDPLKIDRKAAKKLFSQFAPMFVAFENNGTDYCLVGGLAIVAHCLAHGFDKFRATEDADAMVSQDYSNADFAKEYLRVYATNPDTSMAIYDAVFGDGGFEQLDDAERAFMNVSFVGADKDLDGVDTPDFDICRTLNGRTLATIDRERLEVCGYHIWVATVAELLAMKRDTVAIYGADILTNPRPQDFIDIKILDTLSTENASDAQS